MYVVKLKVDKNLSLQEHKSLEDWQKTINADLFYFSKDWFKPNENKIFFKLFLFDVLVGVYACEINHTKNTVYDRGLIIASKYRGNGYGTLLLQHVILYLSKNYKNYIFKVVGHPNNIPSIKLMLKSGFKIYGYVERFLDTNTPRLKLFLKL